MKPIYKLVKILTLGIFALVLMSCSHESTTEQKSIITRPTRERTEEFHKGIPKELQGTYYRSELHKELFNSDDFYKLTLKKDQMRIHKYAEADDFFETDASELSTYHPKKNTYVILDENHEFTKIIVTSNGDLKVTESDFEYSKVRKNNNYQLYEKKTPDESFGLSEGDLSKGFYMSDSDFTRYYDFDLGGPLSTLCLWQVNADGTEKLLKNHGLVSAKKGRYILYQNDSDEYTTLSKIGKDRIQDAETGEIFTRYRGPEYSPKEHAWKLLGVKMKPPVKLPETTSPKVETKYSDKFADPKYDPDLNDEHLDDYTETEFEDEY